MKGLIRILMLTIFGCIALGCNDTEPTNTLPYAFVDLEINVFDLQLSTLQTEGYTYISGGLKGILILKKGEGLYEAYERSCTYEFENPCAQVTIHSSLFYLEDVCCGSTFDLLGSPLSGPAVNPLRSYYTVLNGNYLIISSDPI